MLRAMRVRAVWPLALLAASVGCSSSPAPSRSLGPLPQKPGATEAAVDPLAALSPEHRQIAREVERARGLRFRRPFTVTVVSDKKLEAHFDEGKLEPTADACNLDALWAFGILRERPVKWLASLFSSRPPRTENLLGFFVPSSRRIYIRKRVSTDLNVVAHEMAHALLHDHVNVPYAQAHDDEQLAIRSVSEGDATITAALVVAARQGTNPSVALRKASSALSMRDFVGSTDAALAQALPLFREREEVPYQAGTEFAARVVRARGMQGLDEVWANLPRGTFEIFHPDTYVKGIALPRFADSPLPAGCHASFEGRMGELRTRAFLRIRHPRATALEGASGLLVDRYRLLEGCGEEPAFLWQTAWVDEEAASRFEALAKQRFECSEPGCLPGPHTIMRRGSAVVVLRARTDAAVAESAIGAIVPSAKQAAPRLGGVKLDPPPEVPQLVESSAGTTCTIAGTGVELVVPKGLLLATGDDSRCAMKSDTREDALTTYVSGVDYDASFLKSLRETIPSSLAGLHAQLHSRERPRVTPLGTGIGMLYELTPPLQLEVVSLPVCGGKRVLTLYLRSTSNEGRSMLEDALSSLRPTSVGLSPACADPVAR